MPATYAHYTFGNDCFNALPDNLKTIVSEHRSLFNFGVHGPDILFYDLANSKITNYGYGMHGKPAMNFFAPMKDIFKQHQEDRDAMLAYVIGFVSHFSFDTCSHGYVERKMEVSNVSHNRIETEYEKYLMIKDGKDITKENRASTLKPTKYTSKIISYFFPFDEKSIYKTTKMQKFLVSSLTTKNELNHALMVKTLNKLSANIFVDLIADKKDYEECKDSNIRFDKYRQIALPVFNKLALNLINYIDGKEELNKFFENTFGPWPNYKDIPVLSYEEELKYKLKPHKI